MKRRTRIRYTDSRKALMWDRWRQGESLHQIARLFDRHHSSVRRILVESGGIRPAPRRRSIRSLSLAEREDVSRALVTDAPKVSVCGIRNLAGGLLGQLALHLCADQWRGHHGPPNGFRTSSL